ncbi:hypothetical protein LUZ60_005057 [Juncus effusus]|nr:hypothetical protein LUZ60_005057 [Juncus effusus]
MNPEAHSAATSAYVPAIGADDNWDTEGFEIPSLSADESETLENPLVSHAKTSLPSSEANKTEEKQQEDPTNASFKRKQKLKHKLKEADEKFVGKIGRENRVETLKEFLGGNEGNYDNALQKGSARDWLDPHCNESEFERKSS